MVIFSGEHTSKLDDKGRLVFPAELKSRLSMLGQKSLMVKKDIHQNCLTLYTLDAWSQQVSDIKRRVNMYNKEQAALLTEFFRNTAEVIPDEKSGRILIPCAILSAIGVNQDNREVMFVGMFDCIALWAKDAYLNNAMSPDELSEAVNNHLGSTHS